MLNQETEGVDLELEAVADDRDDLDPEMEKELWKIRELKRLKRDIEKKKEREEEAAELEERRLMTDEQAEREKEEREAQQPEKGQQKFLQKYYHKGACYQVTLLWWTAKHTSMLTGLIGRCWRPVTT